jgi:hypothetical protein
LAVIQEAAITNAGRWTYIQAQHGQVLGGLASAASGGRKDTLFTYLKPELTAEESLPSTNNKIEGGVNAPLRQMLRDHRGMNLLRRIKAVFWWCYMHTKRPLPPAELLRVMPKDEDITSHYRRLSEQQQLCDAIPKWGDAIVWSELHHSAPFRSDWD